MADLTWVADRFTVEVGVSNAATARLYGDQGYGDDDYGRSVLWEPLDCWVEALTLDAGRFEGLQRCEIGRCSLRLNTWWPPYAFPNRNFLGRPLRVSTLTSAGQWEPVFTGRVEDATMTMDGTGTATPYISWTVTAADVLAALQLVNPTQGDLVRPAESAVERITALAAAVGVLVDVTYDSGARVQSRDVAQPLLQEIGIACDSAGLVVFAARDGSLVVAQEDPLAFGLLGPAVPFAFGAPPLSGKAVGCPRTANLRWAVGTIRNRIQVASEGHNVITGGSMASRADYGERTYQRLDLVNARVEDDQALVNNWVARYAVAQARVGSFVTDITDPDVACDVAATFTPASPFTLKMPGSFGLPWQASGLTLGHTIEITPIGMTLTVYTESVVKDT